MLGSNDAVVADSVMVAAIRGGDVERLRTILAARPDAANARLATGRSGLRTPLHVVTDWPGYFPNGPEIVRLLIAAGADPNATTGDQPSETPLHWAASSDDVEVAEALIDGGADIEAPGASIAGGPPLDDAVGYGCWHVAQLLARRGARIDKLWHAAALGDLSRLDQLATGEPRPTQAQLDESFWQACHGGQRRAADYLLGLARTSTRSPATPTPPHWKSQAAPAPAGTPSPTGFANAAPGRDRRTHQLLGPYPPESSHRPQDANGSEAAGLGFASVRAEHGAVDVELLVIPECPNEGATAVILRRALDDVGLARIPIRTMVVSTEQEAEQCGLVGSPTVRIDGDDPFPNDGSPGRLACRVYVSDGVRSGVPDLRTLRQALKRHADH